MHHLLLLIFTTFQVVLARTDLTGCTSTSVSSPAGASIAWYVPETGEVCDFLDCGGGRAPPETTVPGCPLYSGTASYSPSYLAAGGGEMGVVFSSFSASFATASATASAATVEEEGEAEAVETTSFYSSGVTLYSSPSPPPPPPTTTTNHITSTSAPKTSIPSSSLPPPIILSSTNTTTTSIAEHGSRNGTTTTSTSPSITTSGILPLSQQQQEQQTSGATRKVVEIRKRGYWIGGLVEILCVVGCWGLLE